MDRAWLYPSSIQEAKSAQKEMAEKVIIEDVSATYRLIGGMDVSNNLYDPAKMIYAAAVVLDFQEGHIIEQAGAEEKQIFPYIPGFLGFREAPVLVKAFERLKRRPDVLMVDGHGISHPRGLGIASHLGVVLDIPTIGVAKSILVGQPQKELPDEAGSQVPLVWKEKEIGMFYRTKARSNPLIISVGHQISLATAIDLVAKCLHGYRLPEPTRQAHLAANAYRRLGKQHPQSHEAHCEVF